MAIGVPFKPGNPGRPKGALNKRSREFHAILEANNFCPVSAMIECYHDAKKIYDNYGTIYAAIVAAKVAKEGEMVAPPEDKAHTYLRIAGDMAKDIASYTYPKLKAVERSSSNNMLEGMTDEQQLQAMEMAVAHKRAQIEAKKGEDG